jgi:molecular chaperone DnaK
VPQIEVAFDIDANGIVHVSAKDLATGREQSITITGQTSLPKDDIQRMVRDAEQHAAEDRQRKEEAETRNNADALVYQTDKLLADQGDKVPQEDRERVEKALKDLRESVAGTDYERIRRDTETLRTASQALGQRLYEQAAQQQQQAAGGPTGDGSGASSNPADDEVVDAEIVDDPGSATS